MSPYGEPTRAGELYYKLFKTAAGSPEMNVDGSTPVNFTVTGVSTGPVIIERINFSMTDIAMSYGDFGGLGDALTNGLEIKVFDGGNNELLDFTDGINIKANEDFTLLAGVDAAAITELGQGEDFLPVRWTIGKSGAPLILNTTDYIRIKVQDDISGLLVFRAMAQGVKQ
jgi:hypothetical protein